MKKITTGIFAAIALLTMSFTVAEQKGFFKSNQPVAEECFTQVLITAPTPPLLPIDLQQGNNLCITAEQYEQQQVTSVGTETIDDPITECAGENTFCCAMVESGTNKIIKIHCQPQ